MPDANAKPFAIHILGHPKDYPKFKVGYTRNNIMTQMITMSTARKMNLSHASNIMKQVNTKTGGESIRVKLPELILKLGSRVGPQKVAVAVTGVV